MWPFRNKKKIDADMSIEDVAQCLCVLVDKAGETHTICDIESLTYLGENLGDWRVTIKKK